MNKKKSIIFRLEESEATELKRFAKQINCSMSRLIRAATHIIQSDENTDSPQYLEVCPNCHKAIELTYDINLARLIHEGHCRECENDYYFIRNDAGEVVHLEGLSQPEIDKIANPFPAGKVVWSSEK